MDLSDLQLNHTHEYLVCLICIDWIDEHAGALSSRDKIALLFTMARFGNQILAHAEDGPLPPMRVWSAYDPGRGEL